MTDELKWYEKRFYAVLLLFIVFPIGLYLMWKNKRFSTRAKYIWIGISAVMMIAGFAIDDPEDYSEALPQTSTQTLATSSTSEGSGAKQSGAAPTQETKHFPFTVDEYITRYNQAMATIDSEMRLSVVGTDEGNRLIVKAFSTKNTGFVLSANLETRLLESFTFIGTGDGDAGTGVDILLSLCGAVMAVEDPSMVQDARAAVLKDIGLYRDEFGNGETIKTKRNGVNYSISRSDVIGVLFIGEPAQNKINTENDDVIRISVE